MGYRISKEFVPKLKGKNLTCHLTNDSTVRLAVEMRRQEQCLCINCVRQPLIL